MDTVKFREWNSMGRAKPGTKHGLQLLQLLEKVEVFRGLFIPEAPTSACLFCPSDQGVPVLAVLWCPHVCPQDHPPVLPCPFHSLLLLIPQEMQILAQQCHVLSPYHQA